MIERQFVIALVVLVVHRQVTILIGLYTLAILTRKENAGRSQGDGREMLERVKVIARASSLAALKGRFLGGVHRDECWVWVHGHI